MGAVARAIRKWWAPVFLGALAVWMLWVTLGFSLDAIAARKIGGEESARGAAVITATQEDGDTEDYYGVDVRLPDGRVGHVRGQLTYATVGQNVEVVYTTSGRLIIFFASNPPRGNDQWWGPAIFGTMAVFFAILAVAAYRVVKVPLDLPPNRRTGESRRRRR